MKYKEAHMYDKNMETFMLLNGFWPVQMEDGKEGLATAAGNLNHRPELWERCNLHNPIMKGEGVGMCYIFLTSE